MDYRREIDGLRALAVLPVILFHAGFQYFKGGFVGVDVFFVISGYLITTIIINELSQKNFSIINFYERRARRILPVLFFVMLLCLPFAWIWLIPTEMRSFSYSLIAVLTFSSNVLFWLSSGYFGTAAELKPLLHTWSLAVEEQYYLLFPVFLLITWKLGKRWVLGVLALVFFASLATAQWTSINFPVMGFFLLPARGWELLVGTFIAFYMSSNGRKPISDRTNEIVSAVGIFLVVFSIFFFDKDIPFPSLYALAPTVGAGMIILCATQTTYSGKVLGNRIFVGVGLISYSAYLWHQPLLAFSRQKTFGEPGEFLMPGIVALTFILSYFSWRYIEVPFRNKAIFGRRFVFMFAMLGTAFFGVFGMAGHFTNGFPNRAMAAPFKIFEYDTDILGYKECDAKKIMEGESLNYCYQSKKGEIDAILIGDSHAADKFYGIEKNSRVLKWELAGNSSCPPVLDIDVKWDQKNCREKFEKIIPWINRSQAIKTVVLSYYGQYTVATAYAADTLNRDIAKIDSQVKYGLNKNDLFYFGLSRAVGELLASGKRVVILLDIPELPYYPVDCIKGRPDCNVPLKKILERQSENRSNLERLKAEFPTVNIYDPTNLFCSDKTCTYRTPDKILYRDSHHLTFDGSDIYGKKFIKWLSALPE